MRKVFKGDRLPEIGQTGIVYYANGAKFKWIGNNWWYAGEAE